MKAALQNYLPSIQLSLNKNDNIIVCANVKLYYYKDKSRIVEDIYYEFNLHNSKEYMENIQNELSKKFMGNDELDIKYGDHENRDMLIPFDVVVEEIKDVTLMYKEILYTDTKITEIREVESFGKNILALLVPEQYKYIRIKFYDGVNDDGMGLVYKIKDKFEKDAVDKFDKLMDEYNNNFMNINKDGYIARQMLYINNEEVEVYL